MIDSASIRSPAMRLDAEDVCWEDSAAVQASTAGERGWGQLGAIEARVITSPAGVQTNEVALNGVREARVGQRAILNVLNAQQEPLSDPRGPGLDPARPGDLLYGVAQAAGRLTSRFTAVPMAADRAKIHSDPVKDLWRGARTTDTRGASVQAAPCPR